MSGYDTNNGSVYDAALAGFFADSRSAQEDQACRKTLVQRSRILLQMAPIAGAVVNKLVSGVIGEGLIYTPVDGLEGVPQSVYDALVRDVARQLKKASQRHFFDAQGRLTLGEMLALIYRTQLASGDVFLIRNPLGSGKFSSWYIKESDAVYTPDFLVRDQNHDGTTGKYKGHLVFDGIEVDELSRPIAYWVCKCPAKALERKSWLRIDAFDDEGLPLVLHLFQSERPEQYRGLPVLAPVIEKIFSVWAYEKADVQTAILESCMASIITTGTPPSRDPFQGMSLAELNTPLVPEEAPQTPATPEEFELDPFSQQRAYQRGDNWFSGAIHRRRYLAPGQSIHLKPGEDIKFLHPSRPYSGLSGYVDLAMREVGGVIGVPYQVLQSTYETSYASAKAAIATFNQTVTKARTRFVEACLRPLFRVFVHDLYGGAVSADFLEDFVLGCDWLSSESRVMVDPNKEIQYYREAIELGLIDRDEAAQALFSHAARGIPQTDAVDGSQKDA